jgi:dsRNA-specific ribonuclease
MNHEDDIVMVNNEAIFNPYNPINKEISLNDIQTILTTYGITPSPQALPLYQRAFVHCSYIKRPTIENQQNNISIMPKPDDCLSLYTKSNERLEFVGDGVLECVTKYMLYRRFPKNNEGFMTEKKIAIVKNEAIGKIALEMHLNKWLVLSKHAEEKKIRTNLKKLGCLFEAFLGALFLDFNKIVVKDEEKWFENVFVTGPGFQMAQKFVENIFEKHIDWIALITNDDNYKNILQVKIQKEFKVTPDYLVISHDVDNGYNMGVYLCIGQSIHNLLPEHAISLEHNNDLYFFENIQKYIEKNDGKIFLLMGQGIHKIKRKSEQQACYNALQVMKIQ